MAAAVLVCLGIAGGAAAPARAQSQGIAVLVNDQPITDYDVQQRTRLLTVSTRRPANDKLRREAIDQLIDEKLMIQEAKRLEISVPPERLDKAISDIAQRSKMNKQQFTRALAGVGININAFSRRLEAQLLWPLVVQKRFAGRIQISEDDVNRELDKIEGPRETTRYDYVLQSVTVLVPKGASNGEISTRRQMAERIRHNFRGCSETRGQVAGLRDIVVNDLGEKNSATFSPALRKQLEDVPEGKMTPPNRIETGFELTAICSRTAVKDDQNVRRATQVKLLNQEYEAMARRHLRDLRLDANIERR